MHELGAMQGVVRAILEQMQAAGGSHITTVELMLGASGHFTEEVARQHFTLLTTGTPAEGAALEICLVPGRFQCFSCQHRFESCEPAEQVTCPQCGDMALQVDHQDGCSIRAIEVAFEEKEKGDDECVLQYRAKSLS